MTEIPFDYYNKLADQTIFISSLLGGFSIAIVANLIVSETNTLLSRSILVAATLAASSFLVAVFSMTKILMLTTPGFPFTAVAEDLIEPRLIGFAAFILGILSLVTVIALGGWTKSKALGIFTTIVGVITFVLALLMM